MYADHSRAYKVIAVIGFVAFLFLWGTSTALRTAVKPDERDRVQMRESHSAFDADSAMKLAEALRTLAAEEGEHAVYAYCLDALQRWGLKIVPAGSGAAEEPGSPIVLERAGARSDTLLLLGAYAFEEDGALTRSSLANLAFILEFGRSLGKSRLNYTMRLACARRNAGDLGPESIAALAAGEGLPSALQAHLKYAAAVILLENPGDCYLNFRAVPGVSQPLSRSLAETALQLGLGRHFRALAESGASHPAPNAAPMIALVDFPAPIPTIDAASTGPDLCGDSLKCTADVLLQALPALEHQLDTLRIPG
ncbi:MAG: hypothetical protein HYV27_16375 [Candidatus Hydrogenedentes bacterium]|nr:hypothetical protein [Candidatus Hydrogenedentota bacterium]